MPNAECRRAEPGASENDESQDLNLPATARVLRLLVPRFGRLVHALCHWKRK